MSFDFSVSDAELAAHGDNLAAIQRHTSTAKSKVDSMPDVLAWTEFVAGFLSGGLTDAMVAFKDDTVAAHDALGEITTQMGHVREAYASTELTNKELVRAVDGALDAMPEGD